LGTVDRLDRGQFGACHARLSHLLDHRGQPHREHTSHHLPQLNIIAVQQLLRTLYGGLIVITNDVLEDMTQVEEARFRLLQARRAALRVLDKLSAVEMEALPPSSREDYERIRVVGETTIAITEPDWVATAQHEQLKQVANHLIDPATAN
jgi:hypothetical protein